ncbi:recombinase family protein [Ramlibacter rhizophilus]|nr:recombinase family protein [Ramlibacter rhizophilus]
MDLTPAAQYVRMSTDKQDLSPDLQKAAIAAYAASHNIEVVATYEDGGKSGLQIVNRAGMKRLLADVEGRDCPFSKILVYDISRWGRFQNTDASAYYDYHCKLNGVTVVYVAEPLSDEASPFASVLKNLKRAMAAEYSRELAAKTAAGQERVMALGYQMGPTPCLGFRRVAVSADGSKRRVLERGERKPRETDRVSWALAPDEELELVRRIFHVYASTRVTLKQIAATLSTEGHRTANGDVITRDMLSTLLSCEAVIGSFVWGRLENARTRTIRPRSEPIRIKGSVPAIVDEDTWLLVQDKRAATGNIKRTQTRLLADLREALRLTPDLTARDLASHGCAHVTTYRRAFGSFPAAISLAGGDANAMKVGAARHHSERATVCYRFSLDVVQLLKEHGIRSTQHGRFRTITLNDAVTLRVHPVWIARKGSRSMWSVGDFESICAFQEVLIMRMNPDGVTALDFFTVPAPYFRTEFPRWLSLNVPPTIGRFRLADRQQLVDRLTQLAQGTGRR